MSKTKEKESLKNGSECFREKRLNFETPSAPSLVKIALKGGVLERMTQNVSHTNRFPIY